MVRCLLQQPALQCSVNGTLRNSYDVTDLFFAVSPTGLPGLQVVVAEATDTNGATLVLADGALPATVAVGDVCTNVLSSAALTVLSRSDGVIESVTAAVVLTNATIAAGVVSVPQAFSVAFRTLGAAVRPLPPPCLHEQASVELPKRNSAEL